MTDAFEQWHKIYLGLGSNLGDRRANLSEAISRLRAGGRISLKAISPLYQTAPVGYTAQPTFLNLVLEAETTYEPTALLDYLKSLEIELGRQPSFRNGPRLLDIDILFYAHICLDSEILTIPHPHLTERGFVLAPLNDLAPHWRHPLLGRTVEELLEDCIESDKTNNGLPQRVELYTTEQKIGVPQPRLIFVTGQLAAVWLENFVKELGERLDFEPIVAALELEVAAFMTARYIVDKLRLPETEWQQTDALILPGFTGGDIGLVAQATRIRTVRGPNDLTEIEPFLVGLLGRTSALENYTTVYSSEAELRQMQARLSDGNIRIYTDGKRVYAFNQLVFGSAEPEERDLRRLFRLLEINNASHAYYLGKELYKAGLSIKLGMRYRQDRDLEPLEIKPPQLD